MDSLNHAEAAVEAAVTSLFGRVTRWTHQHPRRLAAGTAAVLAVIAGTAFGLAPMAPDASALPKRLVTESFTPDNLDAQLDALAAQHLVLARSDVTRANDTASTLTKRLGISDAQLDAFLQADATSRKLWQGRAGKLVSATTDDTGRLTRLVARYPAERDDQFASHFTRLTLTRGDAGFTSKLETVPFGTTTRLATGSVRTSLFAATDDANVPDPVATQLAEVFSSDIDFHRELRKGDTFSVVYEALTADGEPVPWNQGSGRVLAAEFVNAGHPYSAVWFADASGKGAYFDLSGRGKHSAFLASPLAFSRITSGFSMRFHPILKEWKRHEGVDYGAPTGTPVHVVGDGVVAFAGQQNGYGNVIQVQHSDNRMTVYAHLSRIAVRRGERVEQGERIGDVGATGWATGPHLHFEFRVAGVVKDPLLIAKSAETLTLDNASRPRFAALAVQLKGELAVAESLGVRPARVD
ncbi:MAG: peptidoglycan DD-metalloendopeptidase family protein [Burkholderiaceae bacterium]